MNVNELIETIFANFTVDDVAIPVSYMFYDGHENTYITYFQQDADDALSGDDELLNYIAYYDFDVYSKGNYQKIVESMKKVLKDNGFVWQVSMSSPDMYEPDTGLYHKTLNFAFLMEEK